MARLKNKKITEEIISELEAEQDVKEEEVMVEDVSKEVKKVKESKQVLASGVKYVLRFENGDYKVYEKCNPDRDFPEGLKLLQVELDAKKANHLYSTLEGMDRVRRLRENHGVGNPFA